MARLVSILILMLLITGLPTGAGTLSDSRPQQAAIAPGVQSQLPEPPAGSEAHGLSAKAVQIASPLGFPITNSMLVSWIVAIGIVVFAQKATRKMDQVPNGAQNLLEWLIEGLYRFLAGIIGPHLTERTFWFFATIFIFVLSANWIGLLPGVGTIGWGTQTSHGFVVEQPLLRGANADVNMYQVLLNAKASELSARMVSMKNATDNAEKLIKDLTLEYNKLRQGNITRELLEIAGGQAE